MLYGIYNKVRGGVMYGERKNWSYAIIRRRA